MFCSKGGTKVNNDARFCINCGCSVTDNISIASLKNFETTALNNDKIKVWGTSVTSVIMILMLIFQKWISVPAVALFSEENSSFSLFELFSLMKEYGLDGDSSSYFWLITFIIFIIVISFIYAIYLYKRIVKKAESRTSLYASVLYIIEFLLLIVVLNSINESISEKSFGIIDNNGTLRITGSVYITTFCAVLNIILNCINEKIKLADCVYVCKKIGKTLTERCVKSCNPGRGLNDSVSKANNNLASENKICVQCGHQMSAEKKFCVKCGKQL